MSVHKRPPKMNSFADPDQLQAEQFRWWLRETFPVKTRESAAAALGVCRNTIDKVLIGDRLPSQKLLNRGARLGGWKFLNLVMEPFAGPAPTPDMTHEEIRQARASLDAMRERLDALEGKI